MHVASVERAPPTSDPTGTASIAAATSCIYGSFITGRSASWPCSPTKRRVKPSRTCRMRAGCHGETALSVPDRAQDAHRALRPGRRPASCTSSHLFISPTCSGLLEGIASQHRLPRRERVKKFFELKPRPCLRGRPDQAQSGPAVTGRGSDAVTATKLPRERHHLPVEGESLRSVHPTVAVKATGHQGRTWQCQCGQSLVKCHSGETPNLYNVAAGMILSRRPKAQTIGLRCRGCVWMRGLSFRCCHTRAPARTAR